MGSRTSSRLAPSGANFTGKDLREMRIAILGLRCAGKSTVGRLLSERLSVPFTDTDEEVFLLSGLSPTGWIETHGVSRFRAVESLVVAEACRAPSGVLALGGGSVEAQGVIQCLDGWPSIFLDAPASVLAGRIAASTRPPLTKLRPLEEIALLRRRRAPLFSVIDPFATISSDGEISETVEAALEAVAVLAGEDA